VELVRKALVAPRRRIATRPTLGSQKRRVEGKLHRAAIKSGRQKIDPAEG
jgi:ribosome-associated protein